MPYEKDLVVLVPSKDAQFLWNGVLSKADSLGLRPPTVQIDTHLLRDAGCLDANEFLEPQVNRYAHAMVFVTDRTRSGHTERPREDLEAAIETSLKQTGWDRRARAVVVDPGIGRWLLERELGETWAPGVLTLQPIIDAALRRRRLPKSPEIYLTLGERLAEEGVADPAWRKMIATLKHWFGVDPSGRASWVDFTI